MYRHSAFWRHNMALTQTEREGLGGNKNSPAISELQGLNISLLAGALADTKIDVATINSGDTVISAINNNGGTMTDVTGTISIVDLRASGTLTAVSAVDTDVFEVNGTTYTISTAGGAAYTEVQVGSDDTEMAENMVAAINGHETTYEGGGNVVTASNVLGVVTITANDSGAAGNAVTISSVDTTITASAATLENGSDTGGIQSTGATDQLLVHWYKKA